MDLDQLAGELVQQELPSRGAFRRGLDSTPAFRALYPQIGNEERTQAFLSAVFWQVVVSSEVFTDLLRRLNIHNLWDSGGELIIVMHHEGGIERFDLLVLMPGFQGHDVIPLYNLLRFGAGLGAGPPGRFMGLEEAFARWVTHRRRDLDEQEQEGSPVGDLQGLLETIAERVGSRLIEELAVFQPYSILISGKPRTIPTSAIASPPWGISLQNGIKPISTVGVAGQTRAGHGGVTACLHGVVCKPESLHEMYNAQGAACVLGKKVWLSGVEGTIQAADLMTDSCFIEVDSLHLPPTIQTIRGPLAGAGPGRGLEVHFEGITSGLKKTVVQGCDLNIPFVPRGEQAKVYTKPVTRRGDSGAALLNAEGDVLGFSHYRTELTAELEYSNWIWARSVYDVLRLE